MPERLDVTARALNQRPMGLAVLDFGVSSLFMVLQGWDQVVPTAVTGVVAPAMGSAQV